MFAVPEPKISARKGGNNPKSKSTGQGKRKLAEQGSTHKKSIRSKKDKLPDALGPAPSRAEIEAILTKSTIGNNTGMGASGAYGVSGTNFNGTMTTDRCWEVLESYFAKYGRVSHQTDSMDAFYEEDISEIVRDLPPLVFVLPYHYNPDNSKKPPHPESDEAKRQYVLSKATHMIQVFRATNEAKVGYPTVTSVDSDPRPIFPQEARMGKMNYAGPLTLAFWNERYAYNQNLFPDPIPVDREIERHCFGMLPIMTGTMRCWTKHPTQGRSKTTMKECSIDEGGYFIINGLEKSIVLQARMAYNSVNVFTRKSSSKELLVAEIRALRSRMRGAVSPLRFITPTQTSAISPTEVLCKINYVKSEIPAFVLFRALGFENDQILLDIIACSFYQTFNVKEARERLEDEDDEINVKLNAILKECVRSANKKKCTTVQNAKLYIARLSSSNRGFISSTGTSVYHTTEALMRSAEQVLTRDVLPHATPLTLLRSHSLFAVTLGESAYKQDVGTARSKLMIMICDVFTRLLRVQLGLDKQNDRDHAAQKRDNTAGALFAQLLAQQLYKCFVKEARSYLTRRAKLGRPLFLASALRTKNISHGIFNAVTTGNWPNQRQMGQTDTGVSQTLNRHNFTSTTSQLRRLNIPIDKSNSKIEKPRQFHSTAGGKECPAETPEGEVVGLVRNLALTPLITPHRDPTHLKEMLKQDPCMISLNDFYLAFERTAILLSRTPPSTDKEEEEASANAKRQKIGEDVTITDDVKETPQESFDPNENPLAIFNTACCIYVNGEWLGYHTEGKRLYEEVMDWRRKNIIAHETAIMYFLRNHQYCLSISMDAGRSAEPLFVVDPNTQRLKCTPEHLFRAKRDGWDSLLRDGVVEFVDCEEKQFSIIASSGLALSKRIKEDARIGELSGLSGQKNSNTWKYSHCQIDFSTVLGVSATQIVYANATQAPRITYQSAMAKQAIGLSGLNQFIRFDSSGFFLWYPQRPLVVSRGGKMVMMNERIPAGQNAIVAVACYSGFNEEDSIILNQSSCDRGFGRATYYRTHSADTRKGPAGQFDKFEKPTAESTSQYKGHVSYDTIEEDGLPCPGMHIDDKSIIVGKTQVPGVALTRLAKEREQKKKEEKTRASSSFIEHNLAVGMDKGLVQNHHGQHEENADEPIDLRKIDRSHVWNDKKSIIQYVATGNTPQGGQYVRTKLTQTLFPECGDKFCLTQDHDVLTFPWGFKPIDQVTLDDWIATLDTTTNKTVFSRPTAIYNLAYGANEPPLVTMDNGKDGNEGFKMTVTPNHKVVTSSKHDGMTNIQLTQASTLLANASSTDSTDSTDSTRIYLPCHLIGQGTIQDTIQGTVEEERKHELYLGPYIRVNLKLDIVLVVRNNIETEEQFHAFRYDDETCLCFSYPYWIQGAMHYIQTGKCIDPDQDAHLLGYDVLWESMPDWIHFIPTNILVDWLHMPLTGQPCVKTSINFTDGEEYLQENAIEIQSKNHIYSTPSENCDRVYCMEVESHIFYARYNDGVNAPKRPCWTGNSSRHGQKGTVGIMFRQEDMPFAMDGTVPDIIINPHAFPGRMTIGMLKEMVSSLAGALSGQIMDGTACLEYAEGDDELITDKKHGMDVIFDLLAKAGMDRHGEQALFSGMTGEPLGQSTFFAPCYYQRLKHLAEKKLYAKARSKRNVVTRQPADGRSRSGGQRVGEMERDLFLSHGACATLIDRMVESSDRMVIPCCDQCGGFAIDEYLVDEEGREHGLMRCPAHVHAKVNMISIPCGAKLLAQMMQGFGVTLSFFVK